MPSIFGYPSPASASYATFAGSEVGACLAVLSTNAWVFEMGIWMGNVGASSQKFRMVIWNHDGSDPTTWVSGAVTAEQTIASGSISQWIRARFPAPVYCASGNYGLGLWCGVNSNMLRWYRSGTAGTTDYDSGYSYHATNNPSDWQAPSGGSAAYQFAVYAVYEAAGAAPSIDAAQHTGTSHIDIGFS